MKKYKIYFMSIDKIDCNKKKNISEIKASEFKNNVLHVETKNNEYKIEKTNSNRYILYINTCFSYYNSLKEIKNKLQKDIKTK